MGVLTRGALLTEAGYLASDDTQSTRAAVYLNNWLRKTAASWAWPTLKRRAEALVLTAGSTSLSVGAGALVTLEIFKIFEPVSVYTSDFRRRYQGSIIELLQASPEFDESMRNASSPRGMPVAFKCRADATTWGRWSLIPFPVPDIDHLLAFDYQVMPASLTSDSEVPWYPNDQTLVQVCKCAVMAYSDGKSSELDDELRVLGAMTVEDRDAFGGAPGDGEYQPLDRSVFL